MKTFAKVLIGLVTLTVCRASAQEAFAPLVTENCVAFVHIDLAKVEIDALKNEVQKFGESVFRGLGFDDGSFRATARELRIELDKLDARIRPPFDAVTKELGIREIAVIADWSLIERQVIAFVAVPWKDKTTKQFETLAALLNSGNLPLNFFGIDGFLILPLAEGSESAAETVEEWTKEMEPAPNAAIFAALKSVDGAEVKLALTLPERLRFMAKSGGMPPDLPNEIKILLLFITQKVEWAAASLPLHGIFGGEPSKNADVLLTLKTPERADAVQLRALLELGIEFGANAMRFAMEQDPNIEFQPPPLFFHFLKGFLRTLLPDVEDDRLKFRLKGDLRALRG